MPNIRRAEEGDAGAVAELAERTFRDAFEAMNTAENMALHCAASYGEAIQRREILDPDMVTLVCEHEGRLIGYSQLRWGHAPEVVIAVRPAEIRRIYVAREWHGKGVAQDLMRESFELAKAGGADRIFLGVWEHNPRAIAFYRKFGFVEVGDHIFQLGTDPQRDIVMARAVADE